MQPARRGELLNQFTRNESMVRSRMKVEQQRTQQRTNRHLGSQKLYRRKAGSLRNPLYAGRPVYRYRWPHQVKGRVTLRSRRFHFEEAALADPCSDISLPARKGRRLAGVLTDR